MFSPCKALKLTERSISLHQALGQMGVPSLEEFAIDADSQLTDDLELDSLDTNDLKTALALFSSNEMQAARSLWQDEAQYTATGTPWSNLAASFCQVCTLETKEKVLTANPLKLKVLFPEEFAATLMLEGDNLLSPEFLGASISKPAEKAILQACPGHLKSLHEDQVKPILNDMLRLTFFMVDKIIKKHKEAYQAQIKQIKEINPSKPALLTDLIGEMQVSYARETQNAADAMRQEHAAGGGGAAAAPDPTRATF
jgi:hypothetical protein